MMHLMLMIIPVVSSWSLSLNATVIDDIKELRMRQHAASVGEYYAYEKKIGEFKCGAGANCHKQEDLSLAWIAVRDVNHTLPLLAWQLLALFLLCVLIFRNAFSWVLTLLLCGVLAIVTMLHYERSQKWLITPKDKVTIYLGPSGDYPIAGTLDYLDEVRMLESKNGWHKINFNSGIGWVTGVDDDQ